MEQEAKEARVKLGAAEGELAAEREAGRALRARLASGRCVGGCGWDRVKVDGCD